MRILLFLLFVVPSLVSAQGNVIFTTDFEQGIPPNFTMLDLDLNAPNAQVSEYTQPWISVTDPENLSDTVASATSYFETVDTANRWLITPAISLGAFGNYIQWNAKSQDASYPDTYLVLVSNTDNQVSSFTDTISYVIGENFEWTAREVNLTAQGYDGQSLYFAFVLRTKDGFKLYLDDIVVRSLDNTSVSELALPYLKLYPNPAQEMLFITTSNQVPYTVTDITGKQVASGIDAQIKVGHLEPGTYTVYSPGYSPTRFLKW